MLALGICIGSEERYATIARPRISAAVTSADRVIKRRAADSIFEAYNEILDEAAQLPGLDALVLMHDDVELRQDDVAGTLRALFSDPTVGLVGVVGARRVTSLAWWEGERAGRVSWNGPVADGRTQLDDFGFDEREVDAVDGLFMALSPWVVQHVRFDADRFIGFHGYDVDFCFEVRRQGRRVVVAPVELHHDDRRAEFADRVGWLETDIRWRAKWGFIRPWSVPARLAWLRLKSKGASVLRRARTP